MYKLTMGKYNRISKEPSAYMRKDLEQMKKMVKKDPLMIRYAVYPASTIELIEEGLRTIRGDQAKLILFKREILRNEEFFRDEASVKYLIKSIVKSISQINPRYLNTELLDYYVENTTDRDNLFSGYFKDMPGDKIKLFIDYDTAFLYCINLNNLQISPNELLKIYNSIDDIEVRKKVIKNLFNTNRNLLEGIVGLDGKLLKELHLPYWNRKLIDIAVNVEDEDKRLTPSDLEEKEEQLDYSLVKHLPHEWLRFVNHDSIPSREYFEFIKKDYIRLDPHVLTRVCESTMTNTLMVISKIESGKYTKKELNRMLQVELYEELLSNSNFIFLSHFILDKLGANYYTFKSIVELGLKLDKGLLLDMDFQILSDRYKKLYEYDYGNLFAICKYPGIQKKLISLGNSTNGYIKLELLNEIKESVLTYDDGVPIKEWVPIFNRLIHAFNRNKDLINEIVTVDLSGIDIYNLTTYLLGEHQYQVKSYEDLKNVRTIKYRFLEKPENNNSSRKIKSNIYEKIFGVDKKVVDEWLQPFKKGVLLQEDRFNDSIVSVMRLIDVLEEKSDPKELLEISKKIGNFRDNDPITIISLGLKLKSFFQKEYDKTLYRVQDKPFTEETGVKIYKAAGESGIEPFNLLVHVLGAFTNEYDSKENEVSMWNRATLDNHGICTSYIGNNFLGIAKNDQVAFGFNNLDKSSMLLQGPTDIYSDNDSFDVFTKESHRAEFMLPEDLIDHTRFTPYNEVVLERLRKTEKRNPDYVVFFCSNMSNGLSTKENELYTRCLNIAREMDIPVVVVELDKIAEKNRDKIYKSINEFTNRETFTNDDLKKYAHDIVTNYTNMVKSFENDKSRCSLFTRNEAIDLLYRVCDHLDDISIRNPLAVLYAIRCFEKEMYGKTEEINRFDYSEIENEFSYIRNKISEAYDNTGLIRKIAKESNVISSFINRDNFYVSELYDEQLDFLDAYKKIDKTEELRIISMKSVMKDDLRRTEFYSTEEDLLLSSMIGKSNNLGRREQLLTYLCIILDNDLGDLSRVKASVDIEDIEDIELVLRAINEPSVIDKEVSSDLRKESLYKMASTIRDTKRLRKVSSDSSTIFEFENVDSVRLIKTTQTLDNYFIKKKLDVLSKNDKRLRTKFNTSFADGNLPTETLREYLDDNKDKK